MSSHRQIVYHIVYGTKDHAPVLTSTMIDRLLKYISGTIKKRNCLLYAINGVEDHIHILSDLHPATCLSDYVKEIKVASSSWIKQNNLFPGFVGWQQGYGAFTCSIREKDALVRYIDRQQEHHRKVSFRSEYMQLLKENGVEFDPRYLF